METTLLTHSNNKMSNTASTTSYPVLPSMLGWPYTSREEQLQSTGYSFSFNDICARRSQPFANRIEREPLPFPPSSQSPKPSHQIIREVHPGVFDDGSIGINHHMVVQYKEKLTYKVEIAVGAVQNPRIEDIGPLLGATLNEQESRMIYALAALSVLHFNKHALQPAFWWSANRAYTHSIVKSVYFLEPACIRWDGYYRREGEDGDLILREKSYKSEQAAKVPSSTRKTSQAKRKAGRRPKARKARGRSTTAVTTPSSNATAVPASAEIPIVGPSSITTPALAHALHAQSEDERDVIDALLRMMTTPPLTAPAPSPEPALPAETALPADLALTPAPKPGLRRSTRVRAPAVYFPPAATHAPHTAQTRPANKRAHSESDSVDSATTAVSESGSDETLVIGVEEVDDKAELIKAVDEEEMAAAKAIVAMMMMWKAKAAASWTKKAEAPKTKEVAAPEVVEAPVEEPIPTPPCTNGKRKREDEFEPEAAQVEEVVEGRRPKRVRKATQKASSPDNMASTFKTAARLTRRNK